MIPADVKGSKGLSRPSLMTVLLMGRVHSHLHPPERSGHYEGLGIWDHGTYSRRPDRVHATVTVTTQSKHSEKPKRNDIHIGRAVEVCERAVHPCRSDGHRNQNGH